MRYLVISDLHGAHEQTEQALKFFEKFNCDMLVLLGDLLNHGPRNKIPYSYDPIQTANVLNRYKNKIISVRGNCDSEVDSMMFSFPCNSPYGYLIVNTKLGARKIFLTHGHLHNFFDKENLEKLALQEADIVLSGHTHIAGINKLDSGVYNVNPGSVSIPKGGTKAGFAIIDDNAISLYNLDGDMVKSCSYEELKWFLIILVYIANMSI